MGHSATPEDETRELEVTNLSSSLRKSEIFPAAYKVGLLPRKKLLNEFKATVKETLFSDDPLRAYKNQSRSRQFLLGFQSYFPILSW